MQLIFLGSGPSERIPRMYHKDSVCIAARKKGAKENRTQSSIVISADNIFLLFDCTDDFLEQIEREKFDPNKLTAVIISHAHEDACAGLKLLDKRLTKKIKFYSSVKAIERIKERFKNLENLEQAEIEDEKRFQIGPFEIKGFEVIHSIQKGFPTFAFQIKEGKTKIVYSEDVAEIPEDKEHYYKNNDCLIIDASLWSLREKNVPKTFDIDSSSGHLIVNEAYLLWIISLGNKLTIFQQISHQWPLHERAFQILKEEMDKISNRGGGYNEKK